MRSLFIIAALTAAGCGGGDTVHIGDLPDGSEPTDSGDSIDATSDITEVTDVTQDTADDDTYVPPLMSCPRDEGLCKTGAFADASLGLVCDTCAPHKQGWRCTHHRKWDRVSLPACWPCETWCTPEKCP